MSILCYLEKGVRHEFGRYRAHNNVFYLINLCVHIDVTLESVVLHTYFGLPLSNYHYVMFQPHLEKTRYFMYKFNFYDYEWYESVNVLLIVMFRLVFMTMCSLMRSPSESYVSHVTHVMI